MSRSNAEQAACPRPSRIKPRGRTACTTSLELSIHAATGKPYVPFLRKHLPRAHAILKTPLCELSVALVGDATMARLHQQFMGIPGPTDVLTFELDHDARGRVVSGEVVICVPEARRRSAGQGISLRDELLLYALHGMLHLSGFDDKTGREYRKMHEMEDRILMALGVGAVFSRAERGFGKDKETRRQGDKGNLNLSTQHSAHSTAHKRRSDEDFGELSRASTKRRRGGKQ